MITYLSRKDNDHHNYNSSIKVPTSKEGHNMWPIYTSIQRWQFCKDLNIGLLTRFLRHIMCTTTAIECRTLHVIFISIVDHWYYVGRTVLSYYEMTGNIHSFVIFFHRPLILFSIFLGRQRQRSYRCCFIAFSFSFSFFILFTVRLSRTTGTHFDAVFDGTPDSFGIER